jgi:hypothetical protein
LQVKTFIDSLTADHVDELTSLIKWLDEEKQVRDKIENSKAGQAGNSDRIAQIFTTLSLKLDFLLVKVPMFTMRTI